MMLAHDIARIVYGTLRDYAPGLRGRKRVGHAFAGVLARRGPVTVTSYGFRLELDLRDHVQEGIFWEDYDRATLKKFASWVPAGGVVFDVGSNVGLYALVAARTAKAVHAFEPNPRIYRRLADNVARNGLSSRILAIKAALAESSGRALLFDDVNEDGREANSGVASLSNQNAGGVGLEVKTLTMDEYCESSQVDQLDLIKMDIQGAELPALRGGRETIARMRPKVMLEFDPVAARAFDWDEAALRAFFEPLRYDLAWLDGLNMLAAPRA